MKKIVRRDCSIDRRTLRTSERETMEWINRRRLAQRRRRAFLRRLGWPWRLAAPELAPVVADGKWRRFR
jgi:hypothetical protein